MLNGVIKQSAVQILYRDTSLQPAFLKVPNWDKKNKHPKIFGSRYFYPWIEFFLRSVKILSSRYQWLNFVRLWHRGINQDSIESIKTLKNQARHRGINQVIIESTKTPRSQIIRMSQPLVALNGRYLSFKNKLYIIAQCSGSSFFQWIKKGGYRKLYLLSAVSTTLLILIPQCQWHCWARFHSVNYNAEIFAVDNVSVISKPYVMTLSL